MQSRTSSKKVKFVADQMLGRLVKWLRLLGFDTLYFKSITDCKLVKIAKQEGRILLTRDTRLVKRKEIKNQEAAAILIKSEILDEQLKQVVEDLSLDRNAYFPSPYCTECNVEIEKVPKDEVKPFVPLHVFKTQESFRRCPKCNRYYWKGTHWEEISKKVTTFFK